jgi:hypothetical protein
VKAAAVTRLLIMGIASVEDPNGPDWQLREASLVPTLTKVKGGKLISIFKISWKGECGCHHQ